MNISSSQKGWRSLDRSSPTSTDDILPLLGDSIYEAEKCPEAKQATFRTLPFCSEKLQGQDLFCGRPLASQRLTVVLSLGHILPLTTGCHISTGCPIYNMTLEVWKSSEQLGGFILCVVTIPMCCLATGARFTAQKKTTTGRENLENWLALASLVFFLVYTLMFLYRTSYQVFYCPHIVEYF